MRIARSMLLTGRRARRILDRARNPRVIAAHAVERFVEDAGSEGLNVQTFDDALAALRRVCQKAQQIYRGRNCYVLQAAPWWIFYRDDTVVTVMHDRAARRRDIQQ